jgi:hypothetical protein
MDLLESALDYAGKGLSVIPIQPRDKKPLFPWLQYQTHRASYEQIERWWHDHPKANIGIITGFISDLLVIDIDNDEAYPALRNYFPTDRPYSEWIPCASTGKGMHMYFKYPAQPIGNRSGVLPSVDIRGYGGYVIAPPSIHPNGLEYKWVRDIPFIPLPTLPIAFVKLLVDTAPGKKNAKSYVVLETMVPSDSTPNLNYRVRLLSSGNWSCQCDGFKWRHTCHHIDDVRDRRGH